MMRFNTWLSGLMLALPMVSAPVAAQGLGSVDPTNVAAAINDYRRANEADILFDFVDLLSLPNVASNL